MKKLLFLAVAAFGVMFTSCSKDDHASNLKTMTFNVSTPEFDTRAYGDGFTAESLVVAVYDVADNNRELSEIRYVDGAAFAGDVLETTVQFRLVSGKTYDFVFYASAPAATDHYTFDPATGVLSVNYTNIKANNENLDAFVAYRREVNDGTPKEDVILTRPFAQVNVGTSDYDSAVKAGVKVTKTAMTLQAYQTLDIKSGKVGEPTMIDINFAEDTMPNATLTTKDGTNYKWLSMNYILVELTDPADKNDNELITCKFKTDDPSYAERTWSWVPVKRNYQTNIVGNILTSTTDFKVIIRPIFPDSYTEVR